MRIVGLVVSVALVAAACGGSGGASSTTASRLPTTTTSPVDVPDFPEGPTEAVLAADVDTFFASLDRGVDASVFRAIGESEDARLAWLIADLLRFLTPGLDRDVAIDAFETVTGAAMPRDGSAWGTAVNLLIGWDTPAPSDYRRWKGELYEFIDERWAVFFDEPTALDYRLLGWGGVRPDDRPLGDTELPCPGGCIPALDFPTVTAASGGSWYADDAIVFGVTIGDESRAYPKNIMEIHEMVIDRLGGRLFGMPYCTLCATAAAFDLESVPAGIEPPVLRTSGLLTRSNKVMYDLTTGSAFDMFTGRAVTGPLLAADVELERITVVTSTWGAWRDAHPETTIVAEDGGVGRIYPDDPLGGRDDDGPIFPIGPVDTRLPVQEPVLGVETPAGEFVAFPVAAARLAIEAGLPVEFRGVVVVLDGDGVRAETDDGGALATTQSFWFAWSQFHPGTELWEG